MTIEEFTTAAARIYGQRWQGPLAAALGVNTRTVRLWLSGKREIPEGIATNVMALLAIATARRPARRE
jgi:DNA-binding transcriptional regulator YiaG